MTQGRLEKYCLVLIATPDMPESITNASQNILTDPTNQEMILELANHLYRFQVLGTSMKVLDEIDPQTVEINTAKQALLALCHHDQSNKEGFEKCLSQLGQINEASPLVSNHLNELYLIANHAFNDGKLDEARYIYNLILPHDTRLHSVNTGTLGTCQALDAVQEDDVTALYARLVAASKSGQPVGDARPSIVRELERVTPEDIASLQGRKLLLVMRERFHKDSKARENEMQRNFRLTAKDCGLEVSFFSADPFIHYWVHEDEVRIRALTELVKTIKELEPEFVVFDNLCAQQEDTVLVPELYAKTLTKLKDALNFKLIASYPDAWEPRAFKATNFVSGFVDTIWSLSYSSYLKCDQRTQNQTAVVPFPHPRSTNAIQPKKDIDAAFLGTSKEYNFLRSLWILAMEEAQIEYELFLTDAVPKPDRLTLTDEEYATLLGRMKACIQFSARDVDTKILCGRVWESIFAGCTLLEEENIETKQLLVPYLHYVPFDSIKQLATAVACMKQYPEQRDAIASQGSEWIHAALSPEKIWAYMLLKS